MGSLLQDFRYALRALSKSPGFTVVTLLTLALGIGANSAIFSVVNGVLLRPLPYPDPDRLAVIRETYSVDQTGSVSGANFLDWRSRSHAFQSMAAARTIGATLIGVGEPEELPIALVSSDFFITLGVTPILGRGFLPGEDQGQPSTVVLGEGLWRGRFGADPAILGRTVDLSGKPYSVVGVAPASLVYPGRSQAFVPLGFGLGRSTNRDSHSYDVIGRLARSATVASAQEELSTVARALVAEYPVTNTGRGVKVIDLAESEVGSIRPALLLLFGAVGFVLLIACANVANLFLARAATRQREVAIRAALGAGRWRLVRQVLAEAILLAVAGGALGLLVASWSVDGLIALKPAGVPRLGEASIDSVVLAFTLLISVCVGLAFGLAPALVAVAQDPADSFRGEGKGSGGSRQRSRFRTGLVITQISLALVLLAGAALLIVSVRRLAGVDPGFNPDGAVSFQFTISSAKYQDARSQRGFVSRLLDRLETIPGVEKAGAVFFLPLGEGQSSGDVSVEGDPPPEPGHERYAGFRIVAGQYLETMGIGLQRGRLLAPEDREGAGQVAVVNEAFVRSFFGSRDPIGQRVTFGSPTDEPSWMKVVGVVHDVRSNGLTTPVESEIYVPGDQLSPDFWSIFSPLPLSFVLRSNLGVDALTPSIKAAVHEVDPEQPVSHIRPVRELVSDAVARNRFSMLLITFFGALALTLAAIGVYGVMAYTVSQRTREMGIRLALGARASTVRGLVLRQGLLMALAGILIGIAGALVLTRLLTTQLFGVSPTDPLILGAVTATLATVSLVACLIPAVRATRVDPIDALRSE